MKKPFVFFMSFLLAQALSGLEAPDYTGLNEAETRLPEFKDSPADLALKIQILAYVNKSRVSYGQKPVLLDILASRVANKQALEAAGFHFKGHWNLDGEKPYQRYAFAGGMDHDSENASALSSSGILAAADRLSYAFQMHDLFMAERAPNDGHKKNVLEPFHTHVGLGLGLVGGEFRFYEEFLDRYLVRFEAPASAKTGEVVPILIQPPSGYWLYAVVGFYERFPTKMSVSQVNAQGSYPDFTDEQAFGFWPFQIKPSPNGSTVKFTPKKAGLYYVQVYLDTKDPSEAQSYSTEGKLQASGLVIRVD